MDAGTATSPKTVWLAHLHLRVRPAAYPAARHPNGADRAPERRQDSTRPFEVWTSGNPSGITAVLPPRDPVTRVLSLRVEVRRYPDEVLVLPQGELHAGSALELHDTLLEVLQRRPSRVIVDLRAIQLLDSSYLLLGVWAREARGLGVELDYLEGAGPLRDVLDLTGARGDLHFVTR